MKYNYEEYLKSPEWKLLREMKLRKAKHCSYCGITTNLQVHHLKYKNIHDVELFDLRVLCRICHKLTHKLINEGKIYKTSYSNARKEILKIRGNYTDESQVIIPSKRKANYTKSYVRFFDAQRKEKEFLKAKSEAQQRHVSY